MKSKLEAHDEGAYITVGQAADIAKVSDISIRRYLTRKVLTRYKFGRRTLLKRDEVVGMIKRA